ncbi:16S rRNA (guanine(527)-N(7))-methyltransferase R smG [Desulfonema ishimotonii]|uniref:Ribosomal RNA small subunit methyltransferase G n=1 Tax=Desulfonema ishimotonii TaxID=45657 RepID=A0A401FUV7_9BACT|nr:16S rRNA (guanine(527)-N(7))-methyltransferase RsmG [Desulfonema ishimotonii]GBC60735.1 16S rRNA (guanine(527)-N(7))-methyltransferase R smG [Desulfonema ishimotonii]
MKVGSEEWTETIRSCAATFGIAVDREQGALFARHARELLNWNRKTNLTAITDPAEMALKHFADSIIPVQWLPKGARVLDIGAGGGFPGIPLKIMDPSLSLTLIDAVRKKASFLKFVIRALRLEGIEAHHMRAEEMAGRPEFENGFDVVVCRALSALDDFARLALPLLRTDGLMIALKGNITDEEIEAARRSGPEGLHVEVSRYVLPVLNAERGIIIMRRNR